VQLVDWSCAETTPDLLTDPSKLDSLDLNWVPFAAPGTVAGALAGAGLWSPFDDRDFDASDWWLRASFARPDHEQADESSVAPAGDGPDDDWELSFDGLATLADVWLNGDLVLSSTNMFRAHRVAAASLLPVGNELVIRCRALGPALGAKRPRPGWKTNLVDHQNLRWFRTSLHGRRSTWTGSCAPVGPWRPVSVRRVPAVQVSDLTIAARPDDGRGRVEVAVDLSATAAIDGATLVVGSARAPLTRTDGTSSAHFSGSVTVERAELWWPATHGAQPRYDAALEVGLNGRIEIVPLGRVGFRTVELGPDDRPVLSVNGQEIFARGVSWVPADPIGLAPGHDQLRAALEQLRDAGMNLVRVPGTAVYESDEFLDLCDELGLLVWHDLMFARMDYPSGDPEFAADIAVEVAQVTARLAGHPCVAVVCGGSEIGQQAAMVGRPVPVESLVGSHVAGLVTTGLPDVPYVVDVPIGGTHPFTVDSGLATYFGVGGYRRPVHDARLCGVRFAAECLAFSHLPGDDAMDELAAAGVALADPRWKQGVARDRGTTWDFEDVRDHYMAGLYGADPAEVRATDPERYLDLGRATTSAITAEVLGQWRRPDSGCGGALILEGRDCRPGAGPGLVDASGRPKAALFAARRALSPIALVPSDEGLNGLDVWAFNDGPTPVSGALRITAFVADALVADAVHPLALDARSWRRLRVEELLDAFLDLTYAYRFGASQPTCVALHWGDGDDQLARAVFRPGRPPTDRSDVGLGGSVTRLDGDRWRVEVTSRGYAHFVQIGARGAQFSENGFDIEPGGSILVEATSPGPLRARLRALNAADSATIYMEHG
jgi:beta-mannosidase